MAGDKGEGFSHKVANITVLTKQKTAWKTLNESISYDCGGKAQINDFGRVLLTMTN